MVCGVPMMLHGTVLTQGKLMLETKVWMFSAGVETWSAEETC